MLLATLLSLASAAPADATLAPTPTAVLAAQDFNDRMRDAGEDLDALWELYLWTQDDDRRNRYAKRVLNKILKLDEEHEGAHLALGHIHYDGQWFTSERRLESYKRKRAKELGLVEWEGEFVHPDDLPYLKKGWVKDDFGRWVDPEVKKKLEEGWKRQDLVWVSPEEFEQMDKGLWKCGDEWLTLEQANAWHADWDRPWVIPSTRAVVWATTDRATALKALDLANAAYLDMLKVTGVSLDEPPHFMLLRDGQEYVKYCDGDEERGHAMLEPFAISAQSQAAFLDLWFDFEEGAYRGMGVTFWDTEDPNGDAWAIHNVRMAYGLSFMEALDVPEDAINDVFAEMEAEPEFAVARLEAARIPRWFRWGAAAYASRWFVDTSVGKGGDPLWARKWSASNIGGQGGLDPLETVFECGLDGADPNTNKLINEAGMLVAYCVDGEDTEVKEILTRLQEALQKREDPENIFEELRRALLAREDEIRAFAGI